MKTKVIVVTDSWSNKDGKSLQNKIDEAIAELGDGWQVRSATSAVAAMPASQIDCNNGMSYSTFNPDAVFATTIIMENPSI